MRGSRKCFHVHTQLDVLTQLDVSSLAGAQDAMQSLCALVGGGSGTDLALSEFVLDVRAPKRTTLFLCSRPG